MRLYDYLFYRIYKSINVTNKSIPEWSTIITISILLAINLFSILLYYQYPIESIGEKGFGLIPLLTVAINYIYFIFNKRYLKIIDNYNNSKFNDNLFHDIIIVTYACLSIFILFKLLEVKKVYTVGVIIFIIATSLYSYIKKANG